jgi:predicted glycogen debranching enzyme
MENILNKEVLQNIKEALKYEWLERNRKGAYASSTVIGMNIRREHGLLVVPDETFTKKVIILSKLEESVFIGNRLHEISTNQYTENIFPLGYQYLDKFEINPFPCFNFLIEDRLLQKTVFLLENYNIVVVRYELKNQGEPVKLVIKPFISVRYSDELLNEPKGINTDSYLGQYFVRWAPRVNMPELYAYYNNGEYVSTTLWYHNFCYSKDQNRFTDNSEDLFNPGFFEVTLNPYDNFDIFLSTEEITDIELDYEALYREESERRKKKNYHFNLDKTELYNFQYQLQNVITKVNDDHIVSISTIEYSNSLRDVIFSLPGLLLVEKDCDLFKKIYSNILSKLDSGLLPVKFPDTDEKPYYGAVDLSLWLINLGYIYLQESNDLAFFEKKVCDIYRSIYDSYTKGTSFNIFTDKDGLIFSGDKATNLSWIPLKNKKGDVLRFGKLLEINALWYNGLRILEYLSLKLNKKRLSGKFAKNAEKVKISFNDLFVNEEKSSFYDFVVYDEKNTDFRINQLIPLMLPFNCVEDEFAKKVLNRIDRELLTPYGLRSLSSNDRAYKNSRKTNLRRRNVDYYNGSIWPWTMSFYVNSCFNFKTGRKAVSKKLVKYFKPLIDLSNEGLLGFVPEAVYSSKLIQQYGIEDYTPSLADIVWSYYCLSEKIHKKTK